MRRTLATAIVALVLVACSGDPNEQANKLFVEAQELLNSAQEEQNPAERLQSLMTAETRLKSIVTRYPAANLAVQLTSGQQIGRISLKAISDTIADAQLAAAWAKCMEAPKRPCVLAHAEHVAQSVKDEERRAVYALAPIAVAQAKAGLSKEARVTFDQALKLDDI